MTLLESPVPLRMTRRAFLGGSLGLLSMPLIPVGIRPEQIVIHVRPDGDDDNYGSYYSPFRTIGRANAYAAAHPAVETIRIHDGVFTEQVIVPRGELTYACEGTVVLDGSTHGSSGMIIDTQEAGTVIGMQARNCSVGFEVRGGRAIRFYACEAHYCGQGFTVGDCRRPLLQDCVVSHTSDPHGGIHFHHGTSGGLIDRCEAYACSGRGIYINHSWANVVRDSYAHDPPENGYGFEVERGADDVQFVRCWAFGGGLGLHGFISKTSARTRFEACVANGMQFSGFYWKNGVDGFAYHCVVDNCRVGMFLATNNGEGPSVNNTVRNCIISHVASQAIRALDGSDLGLSSDYNAFTDIGVMALIGETRYRNLSDWRATGNDAHSREADPHFLTRERGGYTLPADSPLRNAGVNLGGADPTPALGREVSTWDGYAYV